MPLRLNAFPVVFAGTRIHFYDSFDAPRGTARVAHQAIDIGTARGTPVVSSVRGTVVRQWMARRDRTVLTGCGWSDRGGNIVLVLDNEGYVHYFAHLNLAPEVQPGDSIKPATQLGYVGNTGSIAAGSHPHLHYQVWVVGDDRDSEISSGVFTRPFGRAVNPYSELARCARLGGARVAANGGVFITTGDDDGDE